MTKVFVRNVSGSLIREFKPDIGLFEIPVGERVEIKDYKQKTKLGNGEEVEYLHTSAEKIAKSLVEDRLPSTDLVIEIEGDLPVIPAAPVVATVKSPTAVTTEAKP